MRKVGIINNRTAMKLCEGASWKRFGDDFFAGEYGFLKLGLGCHRRLPDGYSYNSKIEYTLRIETKDGMFAEVFYGEVYKRSWFLKSGTERQYNRLEKRFPSEDKPKQDKRKMEEERRDRELRDSIEDLLNHGDNANYPV